MTNKIGLGLAALAAFGMVSANPVLAAGATRSAAALPLLAVSVGSVPYVKGAENTWHCAKVTDEVLKFKNRYVQVDEAGRVVLDPQGDPFDCRAPVEAYQAGRGGGFPFEILLGILAAGGLVIALAGSGGNDSAG